MTTVVLDIVKVSKGAFILRKAGNACPNTEMEDVQGMVKAGKVLEEKEETNLNCREKETHS